MSTRYDEATHPLEEPCSDMTAVIATAALAAEPMEVEPGRVYTVASPAGTSVQVVDRDLDKYRDRPRRKAGQATVLDAESFIAYVTKHGIDSETEIWANPKHGNITAVINAHTASPDQAGWGDHRCVLALQQTPAWQTWVGRDGQLFEQADFAELVEQRLIDFVGNHPSIPGEVFPSGAEMLELAQHFQATRSARFERSQRLKSGQTSLGYVENIEASAGTKGQLTVPDFFALALQPFEGSKGFLVRARFRYRLTGSQLRVGYVLERPEDIERQAFDASLATVSGQLCDGGVFNDVPLLTGTAPQ